jgi:hypothetical protein
MTKWQGGSLTDLQGGLQKAQDDTNNAISQSQI